MSSSNKDVQIAPEADVSLESKLEGPITVGSMTVVHPKASVIAEAGPITIGENNIIKEQASIIYRSEDSLNEEKPTPLTIGVNNVFEVGCEIHAKSIGDHNVFEPKCYVGPNVEIGSGCIIGAGCRVTIAGKLSDQTVITGQTSPRKALNRPPDSDDILRQNDELMAMNEIFTKEEFTSVSSNTGVYAILQTHISLPKDFVLLLTKQTVKTEFKIGYLPPIRLVAFLHHDYPSQSHPDFTLSCCWLSKNKLDEVAAELRNLWGKNQCEILFIWWLFLKDQVLDLLNLSSFYDLNDKLSYILDENPLKTDLSIDKMTKQGYEHLTTYHQESIKQNYFKLIEYNASKSEEEFKKNDHGCNVCCLTVSWKLCTRLTCEHRTCNDCLKHYCEICIQEGDIEQLTCMELGCGLELPVNLVRELVSQELYDCFDRWMLNRALDKMCNMIYCPRMHCQYPAERQGDDSLAQCPNCLHAFCVFCKRTYHGIENCRLNNDEKTKLVEQYQNGGYDKRLELEKRYGKKLLTELVNAAETKIWMSQNCKQCPCCNTNIEKTSGCNKMVCRKCNANFCWVCLTRLSSLTPYLHFQDPESKCYDMLFERIAQDDFDAFFLVEVEEGEGFIGFE